MKRIKLHLSACLLLAGSAVFVSSCQDYEPFSEERVQDVAYTREFERQFGEIDPNQNWDLFGQLANGVAPMTRGANHGITWSWTTDESDRMNFTNEQKENYKKVLPESDQGSRAYAATNLGQVTQNFSTTARSFTMAPVHYATQGSDEIGIYWYVDADEPGAESIMDRNGNLYYILRQAIIPVNQYQSHLYTIHHHDTQSADTYEADKLTVTIPSEITTYGFYITNYNYSGQSVAKTKYSESKLNEIVTLLGKDSKGNYYEPCYVATFNLKELGLDADDDQQYICFEDWFGNNNQGSNSNFDLNDAVFGIDLDPNTIINYDAIKEQAILVCEDLNDYDFDFNDVVLGLEYEESQEYQWTTSTISENGVSQSYNKKEILKEIRTLKVTAMAAGGAFESTVAFDTDNEETERVFGPIHPLMGETDQDPGYGSARGHAPLLDKFNVNLDDYVEDGCVYTFEEVYTLADESTITTVGNSYSDVVETVDTYTLIPLKGTDVGKGAAYKYPTFLSKLFENEFIKIYCTQGIDEGNTAAKVLTNKNPNTYEDYTDRDKSNKPGIANAPQMMLFPYYFEWPKEQIWIQDAYAGFAAWVQDATLTGWILDKTEGKIVKRNDYTDPDDETVIVNPDLKVIDVNISIPNSPTEYKYDNATTYKNAFFLSVSENDVIVVEGASAVLKLTFAYKPNATMYINDYNDVQIIKDNSGINNNTGTDNPYGNWYDGMILHLNSHEPLTIEYPLTFNQLQQILESGGIKIATHGDYAFKLSEVTLTVTGASEQTLEQVQKFTVSPSTMLLEKQGATGVIQITNGTTQFSDFTVTSSDENVATVSYDEATGEVTVTAASEGNASIRIKAAGSSTLEERTRIVPVVVRYLSQTEFSISVEKSAETTNINGTDCYSYTYTTDKVRSEILDSWTEGGTLCFTKETGWCSTGLRNPSGLVKALSSENNAVYVEYELTYTELQSFKKDDGSYSFELLGQDQTELGNTVLRKKE